MNADKIKTTYREAMRAAIRDALLRDERVFLMGEDVGRYGGCFAVSKGLLDEFGPERIRDTPLSESAFVGAGIGAAMGGARPIVEIMTVNFSLLALDQIVNNAATILHMSGGQFNIPLVIRMTTGAGRQLAAQHSHSLEGWYAHIPGIKVLTPATLEDARGMLWTALEDPDPVLIFEHGLLYNMEGEMAADAGPVEISRAAIRRAGIAPLATRCAIFSTITRVLPLPAPASTSMGRSTQATASRCCGLSPFIFGPANVGRASPPGFSHPEPPARVASSPRRKSVPLVYLTNARFATVRACITSLSMTRFPTGHRP